jgi:hypothetical protein
MPSVPAGNRGSDSEPGTSDSSGGTPVYRDSSGGTPHAADTAGGKKSPHLSIDVSSEASRPSKASVLLSKKGLDQTTTTPTADSISPATLMDG